MNEDLFNAERFLTEADRKATRHARELYRDNPRLAEVFARLRMQIALAKVELVKSVQTQTAA